jgi:7-cyano-7-deazaguanine synthase
MQKAVCVFSGGLDSTVLLYHCIKNYDEVYALSFRYNQKHDKELEKAFHHFCKLQQQHCALKEHKFINLDLLTLGSSLTNKDLALPNMSEIVGHPQPSSYVSNRNMIMLSVAANYAETINAQHIVYGAVAVDNFSYWDCTQEFIDAINNTLHLNRMNHITVSAPILMKTKKEIIEYGVELGVDFKQTWTCYAGRDKACGTCPSCSSRIAGFKQAGIKDSIDYEIEINW